MDTYMTTKNTDPTRTNATNLSIRYGTYINNRGRCFQLIETFSIVNWPTGSTNAHLRTRSDNLFSSRNQSYNEAFKQR